jgi:hypothetical protein
MLSPADSIGKFANGIQVVRAIKSHTFIKCKAFTVLDLKGDLYQCWIK